MSSSCLAVSSAREGRGTNQIGLVRVLRLVDELAQVRVVLTAEIVQLVQLGVASLLETTLLQEHRLLVRTHATFCREVRMACD